jgi:hypothetical protein
MTLRERSGIDNVVCLNEALREAAKREGDQLGRLQIALKDNHLVILRLFADANDLKGVQLRVLVTSGPETPIRLGFADLSVDIHKDLSSITPTSLLSSMTSPSF